MAFDAVYNVASWLYTFVIALIITKIILKWYRERNYPPGPIGIPLIGYMFFVGKKPHEKVRDLGRKYGDVLSFYTGPWLTICVNDYIMAKELLSNPKLLDRPIEFSGFVIGRGGIVGMNGEEWQEQRRFSFHTMKNLGLGKGLWETMIQEAMAKFTEELKSLKGQPKNIEDVLGTFHASNIISLLLGRHLDKVKDAEELHMISESTKEFTKYFGQVSMFSKCPRLIQILETLHLANVHKFMKHLRNFENLFKKEVEKRLQSPELSDREDYIGCFLREIEKRKNETSNHTFTIENLLGNLIILFLSSNESTMATVSWLLLYMVAFPDIQKRIHDEIDSNVEKDGVIYFDDKAKFPYTMATIYEMLRHTTIAPLCPPRTITEDMTINGYHVPKGSFLVVNLWAITHDPRYNKEPMKFKPERFFTEDNKVTRNLDGFVPFSIGKRNCPGEGIAIMTAFLYFVSFMQKFKVAMPPGLEVDLEPRDGGANIPKPQEICFIERY